jgi:hypothetical protein
MKKLLLTVLTLSSISVLTAQSVKFGAKAGLNLSTIEFKGDDLKSKFATGFHAGGFAEIGLNDWFAFQPEILFSMQGTKRDLDSDIGGIKTVSKFALTTNYVNIPLLAKYLVTEQLFIVAGPQLGFLLSATSKSESTTTIGSIVTKVDTPSQDFKDNLNSFNLGLGVGAGYFITDNIFAEARYNLGVSNDAKKEKDAPSGSADPEAKSSSIQISLGYRF